MLPVSQGKNKSVIISNRGQDCTLDNKNNSNTTEKLIIYDHRYALSAYNNDPKSTSVVVQILCSFVFVYGTV